MKTKILLVDNRDSFTYNLVQLLEESGGQVEVIREEAWNPEFMMNYSRFVFSPGPGIPSDFPLMFRILEQLPATSYVLGICLGHQAIAEYFGGTLFRQTRVQHGQVKEVVKDTEIPDSVLYGLPKRFTVGLYHSWAVSDRSLPECLLATCKSVDGVIMGLKHVSRKIEGLQFHPESFLTGIGGRIIQNWLSRDQ